MMMIESTSVLILNAVNVEEGRRQQVDRQIDVVRKGHFGKVNLCDVGKIL